MKCDTNDHIHYRRHCHCRRRHFHCRRRHCHPWVQHPVILSILLAAARNNRDVFNALLLLQFGKQHLLRMFGVSLDLRSSHYHPHHHQEFLSQETTPWLRQLRPRSGQDLQRYRQRRQNVAYLGTQLIVQILFLGHLQYLPFARIGRKTRC